MTGVRRSENGSRNCSPRSGRAGIGRRRRPPPRNWSGCSSACTATASRRSSRCWPAEARRARRSCPRSPRTRWSRACCCCTTCTRSASTTRIQRALDRVRPYLGSHAGGVRVPGRRRRRRQAAAGGQLPWLPVLDGHRPARDRGRGPGRRAGGHRGRRRGHDGRPAEPGAAPDRPAPARAPGADRDRDSGWVTLPDIGPPSSRPVTRVGRRDPGAGLLGSRHAVRLPGRLRGCGSSMADGTLDARGTDLPRLRRPLQRAARRAGPRRPQPHLDPLPLLADSQGVRVALPEAVPAMSGSTGLRRFVSGRPPAAAQRRPLPRRPAPAGGPQPGPRRQAGPHRAAGRPSRRSASCARPRSPAEHGHVADLDHVQPAAAPAGPATCCSPSPGGPRPVPRGARPVPDRPGPAVTRRRVGRAGDPGRAGLLPAQLARGDGHRLLPEPGRRHRVHAGPGGLGPAHGGATRCSARRPSPTSRPS